MLAVWMFLTHYSSRTMDVPYALLDFPYDHKESTLNKGVLYTYCRNILQV